jgi:hypothetical protein
VSEQDEFDRLPNARPWSKSGKTAASALGCIIASKLITGGPQYVIQAGEGVFEDDFTFKNTSSPKRIELKHLREMDELPEDLLIAGAQAEVARLTARFY